MAGGQGAGDMRQEAMLEHNREMRHEEEETSLKE